MARDAGSQNARPREPRKRGPWQYSLAALLLLTTLWAVLLGIGKSHPVETLIVLGIFAAAGVAIVLYMGELVVIGWLMDFPLWLAERALPAAHVPLEHEMAGEILIVKLGDNIASPRECRSVDEQLERLIGEHHCDIVLDFSSIKKLASGFRDVLQHAARAARAEAEKQGKTYRPAEPRPGETYRIFDDRAQAIAEMSRHEGHGWVVLCAVPIGIRAVSD